MLMNNLHPDVAERPEELVVYGGIGRAARDWESYDRIVDDAARLEDDETLLIQSGKPVGVFRTHADAPRVLIANSNLVPHWANWEHFNELDRKGLMMYGQMTAGSWIYIGSQGIVQGTYETFVEMGRQHYRRRPRGPLAAHRRARRHGRRAAAGGGDGGRVVPRDRVPAERGSRCGCGPAISTGAAQTTRRGAGDDRARRPDEQPVSVGLLGNAAEILPELFRARRPARPADRPDLGARSGQRLSADRLDARRSGIETRERDPTAVAARRASRRWRCMSGRCSTSRRPACRPSITATTSARWR